MRDLSHPNTLALHWTLGERRKLKLGSIAFRRVNTFSNMRSALQLNHLHSRLLVGVRVAAVDVEALHGGHRGGYGWK